MNVFTKPICWPIFRFTYLFRMVLVMLCSSAYAQTYPVWGEVNADHLALPNVRIVARQSGDTATTNEWGKFKLFVRSQDTLELTHSEFPARRYYVLPILDVPINLEFDMATNRGDWKPYREEQRNTVEPPPAVGGDAPLTIPQFPWPIPAPSARAVVDRRFFAPDTTLAQVDQRLSAALRKSGYPDPAYYQIPHGFAMVGQVEQIERNGNPKPSPARWSARVDVRFSQFALSNYLQYMYRSATGYFRVIVFLVTDVSPEKKQDSVSAATAREWYNRGGDFLPKAIGRQPFTDDHQVTAQIYEFEKTENRKPYLLTPGTCSGSEHLSKSKLLDSLTR